MSGAAWEPPWAVLTSVVCALAACTLAACSADGEPPPGFTVTDSAGVAVVSNPIDGAWTEDGAWRVERVLSIGEVGGDERYTFGQIDGIDVDASGNLYVADRQAQSVRVFDPDGTWLRTIGEPGEGPGEMGSYIAGVFVLDDIVVVPDVSNQRVSRFGTDGAFLSSRRLDMGRGIPLRWDVDGQGRLIAQRRLRSPDGPVAGDVIVTVDDGVADTLAVLEPGLRVRITGAIPVIRPFAAEATWDVGPDGRVVTALSDALRFKIRDEGWAVERIVTRPFETRSVTERDRRVAVEALRELYGRQNVPSAIVDQVVDAMEFDDEVPAFASVTFGPGGSLWVQHVDDSEALAAGAATDRLEDVGAPEWGVFDRDGRYLGSVTFPERFRPLRVLDDGFLGVARDDLDVQSVAEYRVVR